MKRFSTTAVFLLLSLAGFLQAHDLWNGDQSCAGTHYERPTAPSGAAQSFPGEPNKAVHSLEEILADMSLDLSCDVQNDDQDDDQEEEGEQLSYATIRKSLVTHDIDTGRYGSLPKLVRKPVLALHGPITLTYNRLAYYHSRSSYYMMWLRVSAVGTAEQRKNFGLLTACNKRVAKSVVRVIKMCIEIESGLQMVKASDTQCEKSVIREKIIKTRKICEGVEAMAARYVG